MYKLSGVLLLKLIALLLLAPSVAAFDLKSPAFESGDGIPKVHVCASQYGGKDHSIPLVFSDIPAGTVALAVVMDDPDAKPVAGKVIVHWVLTDIPPDVTTLESKKFGKLKVGKTGKNSSQNRKYQGPCPPKKSSSKYNGKHTYFIAVYAMNAAIGKKLGALTRTKFEKKYAKLIIEKAEITGFWDP